MKNNTYSKGALLEYKLGNSFPVLQYLQNHYPDGRVNNSGQFVATCTICGKKNKFYYSMQKKSGLCQSCYARRDGAGFKTITGLIMFTESLEYGQAIERLKSSSITQDIGSSIMEEIFKFNEDITNLSIDIGDLWEIPIKVDIPGRISPDVASIKQYFKSRQRPMSIEVIKAFPAYMSTAKFLSNRVIFEIRTGQSYAWLGYLMGKADDDHPKTLNPRGSVLSYMLGGYDYFTDKTRPVLVHEGIFDMFRSILRKYNAVCAFGKVLSTRQISLLNEMKTDEIVLCFDGDSAGMKGAWAVVKKWRKYINKKLSMMVLPFGEDPDSCPRIKFDESYGNRRIIT